MRTYFDKTTGAYLGSWNWPATPEQLVHPERTGQLWKEGQVGSGLHRLNLLTDTVELIPVAYDYRTLRAAAYPPIGDQLDDLFRHGAFSPEMAAQLQAVKTAHPKGTL